MIILLILMILPNILGIIPNWGRWSEMVAVKLPDIMSGSITFENTLEWNIRMKNIRMAGYSGWLWNYGYKWVRGKKI